MDAIVTEVIGIIAVVTVLSALLSAGARRLGQPAVVGQILTGVLLGPTVLGRLPWHLSQHLLPARALPSVTVLGQIAVVVFMFGVGYEIDVGSLRRHGRTAPSIALGALAVPMSLGVGGALLFSSTFKSVGGHPERGSFVLFMGVATAVTALPVLAAIVRERGLAGTTVGLIATTAAGIMDLIAWLVLAGVQAAAGRPTSLSLPATAATAAAFAIGMPTVVRPVLTRWSARPQSLLTDPVATAFVLAMSGAWVTAAIGLHPIFGAFLAGVTMRGSRPPDASVVRAMDQASALLLPLFFVVTGLSLDVSSVGGPALAILALALITACFGKLLPAYAISRWCGLARRQSAAVAALLNTRGLTELVALNVGLADGIINRRIFTVLVLMALITTFMTGPLLTLLGIGDRAVKTGAQSDEAAATAPTTAPATKPATAPTAEKAPAG